VRQHRRTGDVADGIDAGLIGLAVSIGHDTAVEDRNIFIG
jgi:hypothetical protein